MSLQIKPADLDHPAIIDLLAFHLAANIAVTPVGSVHALDLEALKVPDIHVFAGWQGEELRVIGALKQFSPTDGELKSMRTVEAFRGQGLGAQMLDHLIDHARALGLSTLWLETGSFDYFAPARKLYAKRGFRECPPFEGYEPDPNSTFMTKAL